MTKDTEFMLTYANHTATVSPFGASLRRYFVKTASGEWNVLWGYSGGANKQGGQGDVLIPFPGRLKDGTFNFEGKTHALVKNDKDGPNAIHGFLRTELFSVVEQSETRVTFGYDITQEKYAERGFPFSLRIEVTYSISDAGLRTTYNIQNVGATAAPAGVGFHPYFCGDKDSLATWSVKIPAKCYIELENFVPTGRVLSVDGDKRDFKNGRVIGDERYNDCLAHLERDSRGIATATVQAEGSPNRVVLSIDESFDYIVIYTGDQIVAPHQRKGFAIEPMTCAPDAFNHEGWGTKILAPGEAMSGSYTVFAELNA